MAVGFVVSNGRAHKPCQGHAGVASIGQESGHVPACLCEIGKASAGCLLQRDCVYTTATALISLPAKLARLRRCEGLIGETLCHLPNMHSAAPRPALACLKPEQRHVAALE